MKSKISFISLIFILVFGLFLVACSNEGSSKTDSDSEGTNSYGEKNPKVLIGWSPPDITGVFKTATDFMEDAADDAKANGIDVEILTRSASSHTSAVEQVDSINNMVQKGVDVLIVSPADVEAVKPALNEANKAGIPVIIVNLLEPIEGLDATSYIGFSNSQAASVSAYSLLDSFGGPGVLGEGEKVDIPADQYLDLEWWENLYADVDKESITGKVAIIEGIAGDFFSTERVKGFTDVISQFPNIEIVATLPADWNRQKGISAAENILHSNSELDAIWAASNEMGLGAISAVENAGRENEVLVITNDGTPESVDSIRGGKLTAETWHGFPEWGWFGTKFAVMLALGQDVPETYDIRPRTIYKGNADEFYPNTKLEEINWAEILSNK